ncbi:TonB-dependent receptor [Neolewinella lacunae]|uniref:TonB-dependent receptor n=1 Tax=Neolewinella lacunae TaxID=1517758 RepID=A0A923T7M4_9BACT|nr:TonB-dependent receptor [Neolewinella lacunae]MBC6993729.1 TonB-dependent receptor [Neolewinella lacunae]MDN3635755.1 TonB-dependent receptor [Neolewinella lacunae]
MRHFTLVVLFSLFYTALLAQSAIVRGNVFDAASGEPIAFGTVQLRGADGLSRGTNTDIGGFFSIANLAPGDYQLVATYVGYDSLVMNVNLAQANEIEYQRLTLKPAGVQLQTVAVSARREQARSDVAVAKVTFSSEEILSLPSTGGEPDIAQYLTVLPGVVSSGDQGGQLYIRGGSPVQNKLLLDGMTIYNPFHSIGLFSVFETEAIRSADVYTGGFNAEYGGRISAIVDIKTREGNKKNFGGLVSASPFQAKVLVEGPIKPLNPETGSSISFLLTGKRSLLPETSKTLYEYAVQENFFNLGDTATLGASDIGLPYNYQDIYGKVSLVGGNGSKLNLFGFNFTDDFTVPGVATLDWTNNGGGASFNLVPPSSNVVIDGVISASTYDLGLVERDGAPRTSEIANYTVQLNFTYFGGQDELAYGFDYNGLNTNFTFRNPLGVTFQQEDFTTELNGYAKYKRKIGGLILEPGLRAQYYASLNTLSIEPRLGLKYNVNDRVRLKAAGGLYSQNLISTQNDLDIVNFFTGFLVGPESALLNPDGTTTDDKLQKAVHAIAGFELDATDRLTFNVEGYYKGFTQLIELNRNKLRASDPDFIALDGVAYGGDISVEYRYGRFLVAGNYSLGFVTRDDGQQEYPTSFDRRHNVNAYGTYKFGNDNAWEFGFRYNFGSAFPFTQTLGFVEEPDFNTAPVLPAILTGNGDLGILLSPERNGGRLSDFHRLDLSLQKTFSFGTSSRLEVTASVTNSYNRENIFYVDRVTNTRVNQLPILPSLSGTFYW